MEEVLEKLIEEGANPTDLLGVFVANARWHHPTLEVIEYLISEGADVNATFLEKYKQTCICIAVQYGYPMNIVSSFLNHGVDINVCTYNKNNILHLCVLFDRREIFQYLLTTKDVSGLLNSMNIFGSTPLILALSLRRVEMLEDLLRIPGIYMNMKITNYLHDTEYTLHVPGLDTNVTTPMHNITVKDDVEQYMIRLLDTYESKKG